MDEVAIKIVGKKHWVWRAVDQDGNPLFPAMEYIDDKDEFSRRLPMMAEKRDFFHSLCDELANFPDDLCYRPAALGTAGSRHDAKGAMHVAALHD